MTYNDRGESRNGARDCLNRIHKWEPNHGCPPAVKIILYSRFFTIICSIGLLALVGVYVNEFTTVSGASSAKGQGELYLIFAILSLANCIISLILFYIYQIKWIILSMFILDMAFFIASCVGSVGIGTQVSGLTCSKQYYDRIPLARIFHGRRLYEDLPYIPNAFPINSTFANWYHGTQAHCMESKAMFGLFCCVAAGFAFSFVGFGFVVGLKLWDERKGSLGRRGGKNIDDDMPRGGGYNDRNSYAGSRMSED